VTPAHVCGLGQPASEASLLVAILLIIVCMIMEVLTTLSWINPSTWQTNKQTILLPLAFFAQGLLN